MAVWPMAMQQTAPFPKELQELVETMHYRPGWEFELIDKDRGQGSEGLTLVVTTFGYNSRHQELGEYYKVDHYMLVPPAAYDRRSWRRWLLEQCLLIDRHEGCEFFQVDGEFPYAPSHAPGNDPYLVREIGTELDQRTSFRGVVNP